MIATNNNKSNFCSETINRSVTTEKLQNVIQKFDP